MYHTNTPVPMKERGMSFGSNTMSMGESIFTFLHLIYNAEIFGKSFHPVAFLYASTLSEGTLRLYKELTEVKALSALGGITVPILNNWIPESTKAPFSIVSTCVQADISTVFKLGRL